MKNRFRLCAIFLSLLFLLPLETFAAAPDIVSPLAEEDDGYTKTSATSYYGPGTSYPTAHTLSSNTKVTVIAKEDDYYWVSYNYSNNTYYAYILKSKIRTTFTPDVMTPEGTLAVSAKNDSDAAKSVTVYAGPGSNYPSIGSIGTPGNNAREIVKLIYNYGSSYYIEYKTSSGYKRGFVLTSELTIPSKNWAKPIQSGHLSQDYKGSAHPGIDIGTAAVPVYAIADGTIQMQQIYATISGTDYLVSYGNVIYLSFTENGTSYTAIYAHLSDFAYAEPIIPSSNTKQLSASSVSKKEYNLTVTGTATTTKSVQKGELIGYSGNTGNSTGAHLHFELKNSNNETLDPFLYVVFPDVGYYQ